MEATYQIPNLGSIQITDELFGHYVHMISTVVIPYQWDILNDRVPGTQASHCLDNFRIASGRMHGSFYGQVFQDSDVYKWLEALSYCLQRNEALGFIPIADEVVDLIASAQLSDGYLHTYHIINGLDKRWTNLVEAHELYCAGYLIEAAIAYHQATRKRTLLSVAMRFADLISTTFGTKEGQLKGYSGHEEIELALIKLYRYTKVKRYLDTARYFIDQRGKEPNYFLKERKKQGKGIYAEFDDYDLSYAQAHIPPILQKDAEGHAVRALYLYSAMADLALEDGDAAYKAACEKLWESVAEKRMYITGGVGSSGFLERFTTDYDLPNDRGYSESCASVALMMFSKRMASLTKEARYYEAVERALYNTVLAGIGSDGLHYFYVNPLEVWPKNCLPYTSLAHVKSKRQQWFAVACCPTNIARTLASLSNYIYETEENALVINQFIASTITLQVNGTNVQLTMDVDPETRSIVTLRSEADLALRIRIPSYAGQATFLLDGEKQEIAMDKGYALIRLCTDKVLLIDLHLEPKWVAAHPLVRYDAYKVALVYGPFVYCLEEADNPVPLASLAVDTCVKPVALKSLEELPGRLPVFGYPAYRMERKDGDGLYGPAEFQVQQENVRAIPYCLWANRTEGEMTVFQHIWMK